MRKKGIRNKEDNLKWGYRFKSALGNTYFNVLKLLDDYIVDKDDIDKARELVENGEVEFTKASITYLRSTSGDNQLGMYIFGKIDDEIYSYSGLKLLITKDSLLLGSCPIHGSNYYSYYYNTLCVHTLALMLLADDYIAKYNPGDDTDMNGDKVLNAYHKIISNKIIDETSQKKSIVRIEPKLSYGRNSADELALTFRIGIEKLFKVKNLNELVEIKEQNGTLKLGTKTLISFIDYEFDDDAKKYYEIIEKTKREYEYISDKINKMRYYYGDQITLKDRVDLTPEILDMFYEVAQGKTIDLDGSLYTKNVKITEGTLNIRVEISRNMDETGKFAGLSVMVDSPAIMKGKDYGYYIDEEKAAFYRIGNMSPMARMLIESVSETEDNSFTIGKKKLPEFYYRILPKLIECPEIEVIEKGKVPLKNYLPAECEITYYMDANEDYISGRVQAKYGDEEIILHKLTDSDFPFPESRDMEYEQNALSALEKYLPDVSTDGEEFTCEKTGENTFDLLNEGLKDLMAIGEIHASKDFENLKIRKAPVTRVGVSVESGLLNLEIETDDMSEDELLELLESYRKKKKFFKLKNGEFIRLEQDDTIEELMTTMQSMGVSERDFTKGKLHLPLYRAIFINKLLEEHDEIAAERDKNFKALIRNFNTVKESDIEVPESLTKILRGYQVYGFKWLSMLSEVGFGGILADDMGLGKTIQVITLLKSRKELNEKDGKRITSLIVCPASLVYNWEEEFKRFAPSMSIKTVTGTQTERKAIMSADELPEVLITSYDLLKRDIGIYEDKKFDYEIIDEAQFIKNPKAAATKSVKVINAEHRFALTGTPIENRLSELWSIFDYLMPGFLYTYDRFRSDFETAITRHKDEEITKHLKNMVGPFILRRLKDNVLKDLPDKMEEIRFSKFDAAQRKLYDAQVTHMKKVLESEEYKSGKDRLKVLAELTKIRQICCDPELITAGYNGESAKRESCLELIESAIDGGHKILLFSQFTSMFELLERDLRAKGIEFYKITGETRKEDRIRLVHAFNENEVPLFLISLKAGGTGLNLTGADVVIHYDPWWNLAAQNQATDRAHRIGQTKKVSVFKLIVKDTIEEKIVEMQNAKKDLADAILSGESESLMNMSKEQLMELLG
ncbi:DEAD/DEAH box helicase [Oribacterium sp. WCC10]|uniref:DEAD/DEAH box helicase n=1 Tax=Oribacterium sp. WCC10 TaxID=1855343 RepID=UPI0008E7BAEC|nr:SNF2 helicase associated domain-containing protein [Oribacterium sp. WCC10]SFG25656.1 Superfamily II DNA or RNA helicase, SNF2 family [Oribacterium sp. WCC10]